MLNQHGVVKLNNIQIQVRTWTTRCLKVRVNVGVHTIVYFFNVGLLHCVACVMSMLVLTVKPGNTTVGSITLPLTSCLTGLESAV